MSAARLLAATLLFALAFALPAGAAPVPLLVPLQGYLRSVGGGPAPDGKYVILVKIYDGPDAAAKTLFTEASLGVQVTGGLFSLQLGAGDVGQGLPPDLFATQGGTWLGVAVAGEPELPRAPLLPVPYALRAVHADAATKAATAGQADTAVLAEQAKTALVANQAKGLACTGCVSLDMLDDVALSAKSHTALYAGKAGSVQAALDGLSGRVGAFEQAISLDGAKVGVGVNAPQCALDVAQVCASGAPARLVVEVADANAMQAVAVPGAVVYRKDEATFWGRRGDQWRRFVQEGVCGDKLLEYGEACDDGNQDDTDACVACKAAICGDKAVQAGVEQCDDGNDVTIDACVACKTAKCGDGFLYAGVEECDAGAANSDSKADACRTSCKKAKCGDGVVDSGEGCDDGNAIDGDACSNACKATLCFKDMYTSSPCNQVTCGGPYCQVVGYKWKGLFTSGGTQYACWYHTHNQTWNTSTNTNFAALAAAYGLPAQGGAVWCHGYSENPCSAGACTNNNGGYFAASQVGAWGCCSGGLGSGGFVCIPNTKGIPACN